MKGFDFHSNFIARMTLTRAMRHVAQATASYEPNGALRPQPANSALWIVYRLICELELDFNIAKKAKDEKRKARTA